VAVALTKEDDVKPDKRRREPEHDPGVLPGTPAEPDRGPGILPGTPSEKREDDRSREAE
jgi:hypothetical protein